MKKCRCEIRLSEEEYKALNNQSQKYSLNKSKYLRYIINKKPLISNEVSQELNKLQFEMNKIGTNINQVIKKGHESGLSEIDLQEIENMQKLIYKEYSKLLKNIGGDVLLQ